jgi:hypothetical protein
MPSLIKGVGIVSNIRYLELPPPPPGQPTNLRSNFERGLRDGGGAATWIKSVDDQKGYDPKTLAKAVTDLNKRAADKHDIGLIVTVGGTTTAVAAQNNATIPFVSLIGDTTTDFRGNIAGYFYGGINLQNNSSRNGVRVTDLWQFYGIYSSEICLLCNPDANTTKGEKEEWNNALPPRGKIYEATKLVDIGTAFTDFAGKDNLSAMIISSDGFFQDSKDDIKRAHKASGKFVCYPLQIYSEGVEPLPPGSIRDGTLLASAYYALGKKAAQVITSGTPSTLDPVNIYQINDNLGRLRKLLRLCAALFSSRHRRGGGA